MITANKESQLEHPHYTDPKWAKDLVIYRQSNLDNSIVPSHINYSDRLIEWDYDAHERGRSAIKEFGTKFNSAKNIELYLSAYHESDVNLYMIYGGVNQSNGFPYFVYVYDLIPNIAS